MILFLGAIIRQGTLTRHRIKYFEEALNYFAVLKEEFPSVISSYFLIYVELLPMNAIQMRNMFLCASPVALETMPNPFKCKISHKTEFDTVPPKLMFDALVCIESHSLKEELIKYFMDGIDDKVLDKLYSIIAKPNHQNSTGPCLHTTTLHSLILLCGHFGVQQKHKVSSNEIITVESIQTGVPFYIIMFLLSKFDDKGQYLIISAIVNHLRYPNSHTRFFRCVIMAIAINMCQIDNEEIEINDTLLQIIIRCLVERLLPRPPHPWGVIATLAELLCDSEMNIMSKKFVTQNKDFVR